MDAMGKLGLSTILFLTMVSGPAFARPNNYRQPGGSQETKCYENVYREEYVPGTRNSPGYIRKFDERVEVPCERHEVYPQPYPPHRQSNVDDNSCIEGSILGGLGGGALGGVLATQENWIWSIPAGIIGGSMVGCQIDGG